MITKRKIDRIIKEAVLQYQLEEIREFELCPDTPVEFSQEFEDNMAKLLAGCRREKVYFAKRKRIVALVAALLIASMMLTAFAARKYIVEFFVNVFEDRTLLYTDSFDLDGIKTIYKPNWIVPGYTLENEISTKNLYMLVWNNNNDLLRYSQKCSNKNSLFLDDEYGSYSEVTIDDFSVYYLERKDRQIIVWNYDGYNFQLDCPSDLDWETITQMIKSIEPVN